MAFSFRWLIKIREVGPRQRYTHVAKIDYAHRLALVAPGGLCDFPGPKRESRSSPPEK